MSSDKLVQRLKYIRERKEKHPAGGGSDAESPGPASSDLSGGTWKRVGDFVYEREVCFPLEHPPAFPPSPLFPRDVPASRLLFFDTETTGLSGGAGTLAFLLGAGRLLDGVFTGTQVFLADFPGEPDFLSRAAELFTDDSVAVSYNGRAFDSHLIRSRFTLNRIPFSFPAQADLLYPSRRLWGTVLESCSLPSVERHVLRFFRDNDIPGALVPEFYFRFLRKPDFGEMGPVFEHNLQDILSLARLTLELDRLFERPHTCRGADRLGLARLLLEKGPGHPGYSKLRVRGENLLKGLYGEGDRRASAYLAGYYKKQKRWAEAVEVWKQLWETYRDPSAGIELAKYYEHRERTVSRALAVVEELSETPPSGPKIDRDDLILRMNRLKAKQERGKQSP